MTQNQGGVALEAALTRKGWSHGELRRRMAKGDKLLANGLPGKWISGGQKPTTANRLWLKRHLGIGLPKWDALCLPEPKTARGTRKAS